MIDDIALFVSVVKAGSLKRAATSMNIPPSTVSRRLKGLERALGCLLLSRNSHSFRLTSEGEKLFDRASFHVDCFAAIVHEMQNDISGLQGSIRVLAPTNLTNNLLHVAFAQYLQLNPQVDLEMELSNELAQFSSSRADFAIRVGPQADSELSQVKLGSINTLLVASPGYVHTHNQPRKPEELAQHHLIVARPLSTWSFYPADDRGLDSTEKSAVSISLATHRQRLVVNDLDVAKQFCLAGLGIALLPETVVKDQLSRAQLVPVLSGWQGKRRDVYAIWYRRQLLTRRASDLIDYLKVHSGLS
ncbi:LysR family transcriptional regulator [Amphritea sp.]|uniref:LysR family transcriptional regulator n=1 Tax=Amphritea sp. TaxID=1872502 RepID=UPI003D0CF391